LIFEYKINTAAILHAYERDRDHKYLCIWKCSDLKKISWFIN